MMKYKYKTEAVLPYLYPKFKKSKSKKILPKLGVFWRDIGSVEWRFRGGASRASSVKLPKRLRQKYTNEA
jgi:hypothetical protein